MTTPTWPAGEIIHLDAVGQRIMPGDVVWSGSNSSGIGARLVVKLTEHKVLVDRSSPKDGEALLVITKLLKSLPDTKVYDGLISSYGNNINYDVKSKAATAPLRFLVVSHNSSTVPGRGSSEPTHISIHEIRGTTNADTDLAIDAARELGKNRFGDGHNLPSCIWKKVQKHNTGWDRVQSKWLYEDRVWNWVTSSAADILLTMKRMEEIGILHLPTNELIAIDDYNAIVTTDLFKYPTSP